MPSASTCSHGTDLLEKVMAEQATERLNLSVRRQQPRRTQIEMGPWGGASLGDGLSCSLIDKKKVARGRSR